MSGDKPVGPVARYYYDSRWLWICWRDGGWSRWPWLVLGRPGMKFIVALGWLSFTFTLKTGLDEAEPPRD